MRTREEAKYDLDQSILEMYDSGLEVREIARKLAVTSKYVISVFENAPLERG